MKYQSFLDKLEKCPPEIYKESSCSAFRWIFSKNINNSFVPLNLIKEPPARMIDKDDLMCKGYGLSLFNALDKGKAKYMKLYNQKRGLTHDEFIIDKGNAIAELKITENEGIFGDLNAQNGHFTFHEYEGVDLSKKIINISNIFEKDEDFK